MLTAVDPMDEAGQAALEPGPFDGRYGPCGGRSEQSEGAFDALPRGRCVSKRQRGADQAGDLPIAVVFVAMNVVDRIAGSSSGRIAASE